MGKEVDDEFVRQEYVLEEWEKAHQSENAKRAYGNENVNEGRNAHIRRNFPELMEKWLKAEGCRTSEAFLKKTGLHTYVDANTFEEIITGRKIPGANFSKILGLHLPGGVIRTETDSFFGVKFHGFSTIAAKWREVHDTGQSFEISPAGFTRFCVKTLQSFSEAHHIKPPKHNTQASNALLQEAITSIVNAAATARGQPILNRENIMEKLHKYYRDDPLGTLTMIESLLENAGDKRFSSQETDSLFTVRNTPSRYLPPHGRALRFLRQSRAMTLDELAGQVNSCWQVIHNMESGEYNIPDKRIDQFSKALGLHPKEKEWFGETLPDEINLVASIHKLRNTDNASGEALRLLRKSKNLSQHELAGLMNIQKQFLSEMERGKSPIPQQRLEEFFTVLNVSARVKDAFISLSLHPLQLEPEALFLYEVMKLGHNVAGKLLGELRKTRNMTQQQFADLLHVDDLFINQIETGERNIPDSRIREICTALNVNISPNIQSVFISLFPDAIAIVAETSPSDNDNTVWRKLRSLRESRNMTQLEMAEKTGYKRATVSKWENGQTTINLSHIPIITYALDLSKSEEKDLITTLQPTLYNPKTEAIEKIGHYLASTPPESLQAGTLLDLYIQRAGMTKKVFAEKLGVAPTLVSRWTKGESRIPMGRSDEIAIVLQLKEEEKELITSLIPQTDMATGYKLHIIQEYREKNNILQQDLADTLNISRPLLSRMENGLLPIEPIRLEKIIQTLAIPKDKADQLREQVEENNSWLAINKLAIENPLTTQLGKISKIQREFALPQQAGIFLML